jgi:23S rRNA pseudouridine2605 synthase
MPRKPAAPVRIETASSAPQPHKPRHGLARVISKLGACSRKDAHLYILDGRVSVNGGVVLDPEMPTDAERDRIALDGREIQVAERNYIMLNKPRGYVTTASDERGRETVYTLLDGAGLPWLAPVGRLDKASEGLLLLSNDSAWAAHITAPDSEIDKTYHVQVDRLPDADLLDALRRGIDDHGETLSVKSARELRRGNRNAWLEIVLDEGRNRQIRRLLAAYDVSVLRLVRVAIGQLALGRLEKGRFRHLSALEVAAFAR